MAPAPSSSAASPPQAEGTVAPYDYGLTGVDIAGDNLDSSLLFLLVGVACIFIVTVRIFQKGSGHLRKITSFSATAEQQVYWTRDPTTWWPKVKNELIYAPLKNKRHNRELQLSSAVNMGTIPGRLQTILLSGFVIVQFAFMMSVNWTLENKAELMAQVRGRSGHLAVVNMVLLFLMAGRNNPFIRLLHVSFDTFNLFHRWIGRIIIIESLIHTFAWMSNKVWASGWAGVNKSLGESAFMQYGMLGLLASVFILFQSPSPIRHAFYETFLHLHQLLAFLCLLGVYMHAVYGKLPQMPYIVIVICLWVFDRFTRLALLLYHNVSFSRGMTRATVEALPGEACRVTFHLPRNWTPRPGAHVYAYLPSVSFWQSHPFSVAWSQSGEPSLTPTQTTSTAQRSTDSSSTDRTLTEKDDFEAVDLERLGQQSTPHGSTISLVMLARTGMTRSLYERALKQPGSTLRCRGLVEGPYGALESLHSYGTVMLFAGGVGITHNLPLVRDLLMARAEGTTAVRRVTLVWSFKTVEALEWVRPFMDELLAMPGRRDILRIVLFVTRPRSARDVASVSDRVQMFSGRANPRVLVAKEFDSRVGAMSVGVCGPGVFADDVRAAVRAVVPRGKVDFWEEAFTW